MDCRQLELLNLALEMKTSNMRLAVLVDRYLKMTRKKKARTVWVRHWITLRPHQGAYANLMTILRAQDVESFKNFTPDVCRHGAQTHSPSAEVPHLVQRTSVSWFQVGDHSPLHGYRRQLPFSHVSLLRAPQHHLCVGEGDVPGHM